LRSVESESKQSAAFANQLERLVIFGGSVKALKKELIFIFYILLGIFPMLMYLDFVMDIQISRDYGFWKTMGFCVCVTLYAEITSKVRR
jgi:hypothetical protein